MTDRTLLCRMVILGLVTGEAERPGRHEGGHFVRRVAGVAVLVRLDREPVGRNDLLRGVATGAAAVDLVMLLVTGDTLHHGRIGPERHAFLVTVHARQPSMSLMVEPYRARPRRMRQDRDRNLEGPGWSELVRLVAGGTVILRRGLVMADLAAPRALERERAPLAGTSRVTSDAGEFGMTGMGKAVGG